MKSEPINKELAKFLQIIGVDTRFVSIVGRHIFVNNQRFSRFSNKRQETFIKKFPNYSIIKSKIFQRICTRASRILANTLKPGEKIFIYDDDKCSKFILDVIMEPYTRKYGIKLYYGSLIEDGSKFDVDSIALPLTLDNEVENILGNILNGEKIEVFSLKNRYDAKNNLNLIYPLLNVPRSWIISWLGKLDYEYKYTINESYAVDLMEFFEGFIPDVRENMLKSALYVVNECVYDE
jgi:tRNA(Ile)-lysidine synthase TilS/MesJ